MAALDTERALEIREEMIERVMLHPLPRGKRERHPGELLPAGPIWQEDYLFKRNFQRDGELVIGVWSTAHALWVQQ